MIQTSQSYSADLSFSEAGVKSILAVAHDNGGNYVASQTHTLSIAQVPYLQLLNLDQAFQISLLIKAPLI